MWYLQFSYMPRLCSYVILCFACAMIYTYMDRGCSMHILLCIKTIPQYWWSCSLPYTLSCPKSKTLQWSPFWLATFFTYANPGLPVRFCLATMPHETGLKHPDLGGSFPYILWSRLAGYFAFILVCRLNSAMQLYPMRLSWNGRTLVGACFTLCWSQLAGSILQGNYAPRDL